MQTISVDFTMITFVECLLGELLRKKTRCGFLRGAIVTIHARVGRFLAITLAKFDR